MKKYLVLILMALPVFGFAQTNYKIQGKAKGLKTGTKLFLIYLKDEKENVDSTKVKKGRIFPIFLMVFIPVLHISQARIINEFL